MFTINDRHSDDMLSHALCLLINDRHSDDMFNHALCLLINDRHSDDMLSHALCLLSMTDTVTICLTMHYVY